MGLIAPCHFALLCCRLLAAVAAVVLYVTARGWLAGDQLVRIYRKVSGAAVERLFWSISVGMGLILNVKRLKIIANWFLGVKT